jgi:hypothetical protein
MPKSQTSARRRKAGKRSKQKSATPNHHQTVTASWWNSAKIAILKAATYVATTTTAIWLLLQDFLGTTGIVTGAGVLVTLLAVVLFEACPWSRAISIILTACASITLASALKFEALSKRLQRFIL